MTKKSADPSHPRQLVRDRAREAILTAILDGTFQPGEVLDDDHLQRWLKISRTPIRQALYALSIEGLIDMAPQAHTRVVQPRYEDSLNYLQTTGVLMTGVTELVARVATESQRAVLIELLQDVLASTDRQDDEAFVNSLGRYFQQMNRFNPNPILAQLSRQAMVALGYYMSVVVRGSSVPWEEARRQQELLVSAWRAGDADMITLITRKIFALRQGQ